MPDEWRRRIISTTIVTCVTCDSQKYIIWSYLHCYLCYLWLPKIDLILCSFCVYCYLCWQYQWCSHCWCQHGLSILRRERFHCPQCYSLPCNTGNHSSSLFLIRHNKHIICYTVILFDLLHYSFIIISFFLFIIHHILLIFITLTTSSLLYYIITYLL